jgi:hypothetical protein
MQKHKTKHALTPPILLRKKPSPTIIITEPKLDISIVGRPTTHQVSCFKKRIEKTRASPPDCPDNGFFLQSRQASARSAHPIFNINQSVIVWIDGNSSENMTV